MAASLMIFVGRPRAVSKSNSSQPSPRWPGSVTGFPSRDRARIADADGLVRPVRGEAPHILHQLARGQRRCGGKLAPLRRGRGLHLHAAAPDVDDEDVHLAPPAGPLPRPAPGALIPSKPRAAGASARTAPTPTSDFGAGPGRSQVTARSWSVEITGKNGGGAPLLHSRNADRATGRAAAVGATSGLGLPRSAGQHPILHVKPGSTQSPRYEAGSRPQLGARVRPRAAHGLPSVRNSAIRALTSRLTRADGSGLLSGNRKEPRGIVVADLCLFREMTQ